MTTDQTAYVEVLARLLCAADGHVYGDDHPTWQQLSTEPGRRVQDDYRKAARWLAARLTVSSVGQAPATNQTALRDAIAEALMRWAERNNNPQYAPMRRSETVKANAYSRADAVLAVLPATASQAAEIERLREELDTAKRHLEARRIELLRVNEQRRLADEAAAGRVADDTQPLPRRGDAVEAWLKGLRDEWAPETARGWQVLDEALSAYRLHADTGTPLSEHVCEGRAVGDCECLETEPAVGGAQQQEDEREASGPLPRTCRFPHS